MNKERIVEETLTRNYEKYYRLAFSYTHNEADAQDVVQEGAYKAILKSGSLKNPQFADTWVYRIIMNEAMSFLKRKGRVFVSLDDIQEQAEETYTDQYADMDLKQAVEALDPVDRAVVILRYFEELKFDEIARITMENKNTVKTRLYRALKKLGVILSADENFSR